MPTSTAIRSSATALLVLMALAAGACTQAPSSPTAPSAVLSRGAAPQAGPTAAGDTLPQPAALGASRFMAFGDSITSYPGQLQTQLRSSFPSQNMAVENRGVPGDEVGLALSSGRFARDMATFQPQGLLLLEGINDLNNGASVSTVVNGLAQMVDIARLYNTTVLVTTMFQTCESTDPNTGRVRLNSTEKIVPFNAAIRSLAAGRQNVYVVDVYAAFGNNCGPDGGVGLLGGDGLHPTVTGYTVMANAFQNALRARFPVRGSFQ
jgi:lysophospholipase L1-like esterase